MAKPTDTKTGQSEQTSAPAAEQSKVTSTTSEMLRSMTVVDDFEDTRTGEMFGGSYPQLELAEEQVSPLLRYIKDTQIQIENDAKEVEMRTVPVAAVVRQFPDGKTEDTNMLFSLPINAVFKKHWEAAAVKPGDAFKIKRYKDATKKRGKGSGNKMKVHALKMYARAAVA